VLQGFDGVPVGQGVGQKPLNSGQKPLNPGQKPLNHRHPTPLKCLKDKDGRKAFFHFSLAKSEAFF